MKSVAAGSALEFWSRSRGIVQNTITDRAFLDSFEASVEVLLPKLDCIPKRTVRHGNNPGHCLFNQIRQSKANSVHRIDATEGMCGDT